MSLKERPGFVPELQILKRVRKLVKYQPASNSSSHDYLDSQAKRKLDILLGIAVALPGIPLIGFAATVNKLTNPNESAFYKTKRLGKNGQEINVFKIRTMRSVDTNETVFTEIDQKRINWLGRLLRRTSIDELPQLFNLLKGDLSAVGIRAMPEWEIKFKKEELGGEVFDNWYTSYSAHKPGGSGLHQIMGNKNLNAHQRTRLDRFYITHANLGFDLYIILSSVVTLIHGRGLK